MVKSNNLDKQELEKLYRGGLSLTGISSTLKVPLHKIRYWMNKYKISRRSISDAVYLKHNPQGDPFRLKINLSPEEEFLRGLGLGIFWGEGNKSKNTSGLRVTNTDPGIIRAFKDYVKTLLGLDERRFSYSIVSFNDADPQEVRSYWARQLGISPEKFGKITIVPKQGKGTYRRKSRYGVCTVLANNSKLRMLVLDEINNLRVRFSPG